MANGEDLHPAKARPGGNAASTPLLTAGADADAVLVARPDARSPFLIVADHAGHAIPSALADLGLPEAERLRHIGVDIGIAGVAERLGAALGATTITQHYSRLVIDCNRAVGAPGSVVTESDGTRVPANAALSAEALAARAAAIHTPYHAAIAAALRHDRVLVALHSFTPVMRGVARPWHVGVLHMGDRFALAMLAVLRAEPDLIVGDNHPYAMDGTDYTVPHHALPRGLPYVEVEIRQDLIGSEAGQVAWAARLARLLPLAWEQVSGGYHI